MVDSYDILGMEWLAPYHVVLDCYIKIVTLTSSGVPRVAWKGVLQLGPKRDISFL